MKFRGITYFDFLDHEWIQKLWKRWFCPKNIHLLDECESPDDHYLNCDACDLMIHIDKFDETYVEK